MAAGSAENVLCSPGTEHIIINSRILIILRWWRNVVEHDVGMFSKIPPIQPIYSPEGTRLFK